MYKVKTPRHGSVAPPAYLSSKAGVRPRCLCVCVHVCMNVCEVYEHMCGMYEHLCSVQAYAHECASICVWSM